MANDSLTWTARLVIGFTLGAVATALVGLFALARWFLSGSWL